jgi:hypothetical protein
MNDLTAERQAHLVRIARKSFDDITLDDVRALVGMAQLRLGPSFQRRVDLWMQTCFGSEIAADRAERNHRFLEEALELVQSCGTPRDDAHALVEYVYGRPTGETLQEAGGVMVTLAALCLAHGVSMNTAAETELERVWGKVDLIRAKQAAKPRGSALPVYVEPGNLDALRYRYLRSRDLDTIADGGVFAGTTPRNMVLSGGDLDRAVDDAMGQQVVPPLDPWDMIERLRREEGHTVTLLCDNPDFEGPGAAVLCCGAWTLWNDRRFTGDTVIEALKVAVAAMEHYDAMPNLLCQTCNVPISNGIYCDGCAEVAPRFEPAPVAAPLGFCPKCGAPGISREKRPNGNDTCEHGDIYPSVQALVPARK